MHRASPPHARGIRASGVTPGIVRRTSEFSPCGRDRPGDIRWCSLGPGLSISGSGGSGYSASMKMHSPGHSSADSIVASSMSSGMLARPSGPPGLAEDLVAFLDVGEAVVEQREHGRGDLLAEPVTGAEVLVDPDLHRHWVLTSSWAVRGRTIGHGRGKPRFATESTSEFPTSSQFTKSPMRKMRIGGMHRWLGCPGVGSIVPAEIDRVSTRKEGHRGFRARATPRRVRAPGRRAPGPAEGARGRGRRPPPPPPGRAQAGAHPRGAPARDQGPARPGRLPERTTLGHAP